MMFEVLFALSLLANAGLIGYLYSLHKRNSTLEITSENIKTSVQKDEQECVTEKATKQLQETIDTIPNTADIPFFKTEKDKLFFLLNEIDGKRRNQLLGITSAMYSDEQLSKQWFKRMSNKVHPDKNPNDPRAAVAFDNLKKLYSLMTL